MENEALNNLPPFYVGQKVVAIFTHTQGLFIKGQIFTVKNIFLSKCKCKAWSITIGLYSNNPLKECAYCHTVWSNDFSFIAERFAPLQELVFPSLTMSRVIEKERELISMN